MWCFVRLLPFLVGHSVPEGNRHWGLFLSLLDLIEWVCAPAITQGGIGYLRGIIEDCLDLFKDLYPEVSTKPKAHYITHYPTQIKKFGPLSRCWTIRFEGKHVFFKGIFQRTKNRKNICKTLAERHQRKQALRHESETYLSSHNVESTGRSNEFILFLPKNVQFLIKPLIGDAEFIVTAKKMAIGSFSYWVGCCVVIDHDNGIYVFGEVKYIFECQGDHFLCCKKMAIKEYARHYHSYVICETGEYVVLPYATLYDPQPFAIYELHGKKHTMLKYHIC